MVQKIITKIVKWVYKRGIENKCIKIKRHNERKNVLRDCIFRCGSGSMNPEPDKEKVCCGTAFLMRLWARVKSVLRDRIFRCGSDHKNIFMNRTLFIRLRIRERKKKFVALLRSCNIRFCSSIKIKWNEYCMYKIFSGSASCAGSVLQRYFSHT
jgi:hypothetical protein